MSRQGSAASDSARMSTTTRRMWIGSSTRSAGWCEGRIARLWCVLRLRSVHMSVEAKVSGLGACDNEGCAGQAGAEPHAWETAHHEDYALRWSGYRQQIYRRRPGGASAAGRGAVLGQARQRACVGGSAGASPAEGRPGADRVLRSRAVRVRALSPAELQTGREVPGGGAVADPAPAGRSGEDEPPRLPELGEVVAGGGADGGVGPG